MSSITQQMFMTKMIRAGYEPADVNLWQSLLQQAKTNIGESHTFVFLLLDMARHNKCDVLDIVKTGRVCSNEKVVNDKFMNAIMNAVNSDAEDDGPEPHAVITSVKGTQVLDLTCDEELSEDRSGSYEETSEPYNDNPNSVEAYEIDGFVVADHVSQPDDDEDIADKLDGLKQRPKKRLLKRKLSVIPEE